MLDGSASGPGNWTRVHNRLIDEFGPRIGAVGISLYLALKRHYNQETGQCNPQHQTLADELRVGRATIKRYLRVLRRERLITSEPSMRSDGCISSNQYRFLPMEGGWGHSDPTGHHDPTGHSGGVGSQRTGGGVTVTPKQDVFNKRSSSIPQKRKNTGVKPPAAAARARAAINGSDPFRPPPETTESVDADDTPGQIHPDTVTFILGMACTGFHQLVEPPTKANQLWFGQVFKYIARNSHRGFEDFVEDVDMYWLSQREGDRPQSMQQARTAFRHGVKRLIRQDEKEGNPHGRTTEGEPTPGQHQASA